MSSASSVPHSNPPPDNALSKPVKPANGDITTHYSAAEIEELRHTVQRIVSPRVMEAPTLMIVRKTRTGVGKTSANEKGISA